VQAKSEVSRQSAIRPRHWNCSVLKVPGEIYAQSNTSLTVVLRDPLKRVAAEYNERVAGSAALCDLPLSEHTQLFGAELNETVARYVSAASSNGAHTSGDNVHNQPDLLVRSLVRDCGCRFACA
jgi:hypothetical protein